MPIRIEDIPGAPQVGNPTLNTPGVRRPQIRPMDVSGAELDPSGLARTQGLLAGAGNDVSRATNNLAQATEGTKTPLLDPNTGQAQAQAIGNVGQAIGIAGNVASHFAQKMADANDANTLAQASIAMDSEFAAHKDDIAQNKFPETEWLSKWQEDRVPALEKALDGLNPSNRVKAQLQQNFAIFNAKAAVDIGAAATDRHLQIIGGNLLNAAELAFANNHLEEAHSTLIQAVKVGAIRPDQAQEKWQQMTSKAEEEQATFLTQSNPKAVIDDYKEYQHSGKSAIWPDAKPSQMNSRFSAASQQFRVLQADASDSADDSIASGEFTTPEQIQKFGEQNDLPQDVIQSHIKALEFRESQSPAAQAGYLKTQSDMIADMRQNYNPAADTDLKSYLAFQNEIRSKLPEGMRQPLLDELRDIRTNGLKPGADAERGMVKMVTDLHNQGFLNSAGYDPKHPEKIIDPEAAKYSAVAQTQLLNQIHEMIQKNPGMDPMEAKQKIEDIIKPKITGKAASDALQQSSSGGWFGNLFSSPTPLQRTQQLMEGQDVSGFYRSGRTSPRPTPTPNPNDAPKNYGANLDPKLINFVKDAEDFSPKAFDDFHQVSIGYGTRAKPGEKTITKEEADKRLAEELTKHAFNIDKATAQSGIKLTPNQRAALISFDFNTGDGAHLVSTSHSAEEIAARLPTWNKVTVNGKKVVSEGLVNRRAKEMALFNA